MKNHLHQHHLQCQPAKIQTQPNPSFLAGGYPVFRNPGVERSTGDRPVVLVCAWGPLRQVCSVCAVGLNRILLQSRVIFGLLAQFGKGASKRTSFASEVCFYLCKTEGSQLMRSPEEPL